MGDYKKLSKEIQEKIEFDKQTGWKNPYACKDCDAVRRHLGQDKPLWWRPTFVSETETILHNPAT